LEGFTTKQIGDYSEASFVAWCLRYGAGVSIPIGDRLPYDVIVDVLGTLIRVQVKTAYQRSEDTFSINLASVSTKDGEVVHNTYEGKVDAIVAYNLSSDKFYVLKPGDIADCKREFKLRLGPAKNGQTVGVHMAEDYELTDTLRLLPGQ